MGADASAGPAGSVPAVDRTGDDDDDVDADLPLGSPLPPDDRLWRHPSELASAGLPSSLVPQRSAPSPEPAADRRPRPRRGGGVFGLWLPVVLAGTVGALLTAGLLTVTGGFTGSTVQSDTAAPSSTVALAISSQPAPPGLADMAERLQTSLFAVSGVASDGRVSRGSAVAIRSDHVLTAARLVVGSPQLEVLVRGVGRKALLVGADPDTDLAVLSVDGGGLVPASWGAAADLRPGDPAIAVSSSPAAETGPTVTAGIVSGIARTLAFAGTELRGLLQVDRPVPPEGAGGALLDPAGAVVGITLPTAISSVPFGYAVPAEVARDVARQLMAKGRVVHPWLGVEGIDKGMSGGAVVQRVKPASPAARAGLLDGDVVTEIDGVPTPTMGVLLLELRLHQPGETVRLLVLRAGRPVNLLVTLTDRPVTSATATSPTATAVGALSGGAPVASSAR
jgi:S1-C subfamily serine protease